MCLREEVSLWPRAKRQNHTDKQENAFWGHFDIDFFFYQCFCYVFFFRTAVCFDFSLVQDCMFRTLLKK